MYLFRVESLHPSKGIGDQSALVKNTSVSSIHVGSKQPACLGRNTVRSSVTVRITVSAEHRLR